jgi:hypothetical protein
MLQVVAVKKMVTITAVCVYCGDLATCRDHIVPYLYAGLVPKRVGGNGAGRTVPSCNTCNNALGSKLFKTWEERCHYIWQWRTNRGLPIFNQDTVVPSPVSVARPLMPSSICVYCKTGFFLKQLNSSTLYCSKKCRGAQWRLMHPPYRGGFRRCVLPADQI